MITFTLAQVAEAVQATRVQHIDETARIQGVSTDSRDVKKNQLFIPLIGERTNGHKYVCDVVRQGGYALWQKDQPNAPEDIPLIFVDNSLQALQDLAKAYRMTLDATFIGITGSSGKTSTKDIIASVCKEVYTTQKTAGNRNNEVGLPLTILGLEPSAQVAVIEMGISDFKEMDLLTDIVKPHIAVITSISESHIDNFKTMEHIVQEKFAIVRGLQEQGVLFYNADAPGLHAYIKNHPIAQDVISYGTCKDANVQITSSEVQTDGMHFSISAAEKHLYHLPMLGDHMVLNAVSAILCGITLGMEVHEIQDGLHHLEMTHGRNEMKRVKKTVIIDDTYNSNPGSLVASLSLLSRYPLKVKKVAVIGDMFGLGEQTMSLHRNVGHTCSFEDIDELWVIGDASFALGKEVEIRQLPIRVVYFTKKVELKHWIEEQCEQYSMILVKASRGMTLEDVISD